jgi:radical SAM-linked protein
LAIRYAIEGDLRFISHHDTLRLVERALNRAELPVRYSQGFNPRPRISLVLPRPVGVASKDDLLVVEFETPVPESEIQCRLAAQLPSGMTLSSVESWDLTRSPQPERAEYCLPLDPCQAASLVERAGALIAAKAHVVERPATAKDRRPRVFDIRPFIESIEVQADRLCWTQRIAPEGTPRVAEVLGALGLAAQDHLHRVSRERLLVRL